MGNPYEGLCSDGTPYMGRVEIVDESIERCVGEELRGITRRLGKIPPNHFIESFFWVTEPPTEKQIVKGTIIFKGSSSIGEDRRRFYAMLPTSEERKEISVIIKRGGAHVLTELDGIKSYSYAPTVTKPVYRAEIPPSVLAIEAAVREYIDRNPIPKRLFPELVG